MQQGSCHHSEEEKAIIGTRVSVEVKMSVIKEYKITHVCFIHHSFNLLVFKFISN